MQSLPHQHPRSKAEESAVRYHDDVRGMRADLARLGVQLPPDRFTDADLMRFASTHGFHTAISDGQKEAAKAEATAAIADTAAWAKEHEFIEGTA